MTLQLLVSVTDGFNFTTSTHRSEMTEEPRGKMILHTLLREQINSNSWWPCNYFWTIFNVDSQCWNTPNKIEYIEYVQMCRCRSGDVADGTAQRKRLSPLKMMCPIPPINASPLFEDQCCQRWMMNDFADWCWDLRFLYPAQQTSVTNNLRSNTQKWNYRRSTWKVWSQGASHAYIQKTGDISPPNFRLSMRCGTY